MQGRLDAVIDALHVLPTRGRVRMTFTLIFFPGNVLWVDAKFFQDLKQTQDSTSEDGKGTKYKLTGRATGMQDLG